MIVALLFVILGFAAVFFVGLRHRWLFWPMILAWASRAGAALFHRFVYPLPDGVADAVAFNNAAIIWAERFGCTLTNPAADSANIHLYSRILATIYGCLDYSVLAAQFLNVMLGSLSVGYLARATALLWGRRPASRVAYILALYPIFVMYGAITLREAPIYFFVSLGIYYVIKYIVQSKRVSYLVYSALAFLIGSIFHGAVAFALISIPIAVSESLLSRTRQGADRIFLKFLLVVIGGVAAAGLVYYADHISLNKFGNLGSVDAERLVREIENRTEGGAAYLTGLSVSGPTDVVWQAPIRMVYFLFSPFVWDVRSPMHIIGLVDGLFYIWMTYLLIKYWGMIRTRSVLPIVVTCLLLVFVFAFGTGNFGTALRHRAKFYPVILVVVAPFIGRKIASRDLGDDGVSVGYDCLGNNAAGIGEVRGRMILK